MAARYAVIVSAVDWYWRADSNVVVGRAGAGAGSFEGEVAGGARPDDVPSPLPTSRIESLVDSLFEGAASPRPSFRFRHPTLACTASEVHSCHAG